MIAILDTKTFRKHKQVEVMLVGQFELGRHQHWLATQLIIAKDRGEVFDGPLVREGSARLDVQCVEHVARTFILKVLYHGGAFVRLNNVTLFWWKLCIQKDKCNNFCE